MPLLSSRPRIGASRHAAAWMAARACVALLCSAGVSRAQEPAPASGARDTARVGAPRDSARPAAGRRPAATIAPRAGLEPPISPRRAFLTSLLVPGLGQSRLQRPSAGAGFFLVELGALTMLQKSLGDLREAKRLRADTVAAIWPVDPATGGRLGARPPTESGAFGEGLIRARRTHLEDWAAVLVFNHLIAGAEAYVAANLWDVPAQVSMRMTPSGARALVVAVRW